VNAQEMADYFRAVAGSAALQIVRRYIDASDIAFEGQWRLYLTNCHHAFCGPVRPMRDHEATLDV
jgi:hypothetical protein